MEKYEHLGFESGAPLYASQLIAMEEGIINAQEMAQAGLAGAANMEKGTGSVATNQSPRTDKVTQKEGETVLHFDFTGHSDAGMGGRVQYGAVGNYSASLNGRSAALNKHSTAMGNSTVAKGEESLAQGYETIAEGNSSFAGGSRTWAQGTASATLGEETVAMGEGALATGVRTGAYAAAASSFGIDNQATGYASSVFGGHNTATEIHQTVVGQYNRANAITHIDGSAFHSVFQVGCGTDGLRQNALDIGEGGTILIYWNGGYYILNEMLNLIANAHGGYSFFDGAKVY